MIAIPQVLLAFFKLPAFISQPNAEVASPSNVPQLVNIRVECEYGTIFEGRVWSKGHSVSTWSSRGMKHPCQGHDPNDLGATAISVLDDTAKMVNFNFDGIWYEDLNDFFITSIAGFEETDTKFWGYFINGTMPSKGGCGARVNTGDTVLWLYDSFTTKSPSLLKLDLVETPLDPTCLSDPWAWCEVDRNQGVKFIVTNARSRKPVPGAVLNSVEETDENGLASLVFDEVGPHRVQAEHVGSVRSNGVTINVIEEL